jgi:N-methylhydantoinase B
VSSKIRGDLFKLFLQQTLAPFDSAACITNEGEILDVKYETLADIGTLGTAATTVTKYFPLQMGDVVILNDPYSGGTTLSMITILTPLLMNHPQIPPLYLIVRTGFRAKLVVSKTLEEEGLRIPPTPLAQARKMNEMVLTAMQSHPLCPTDLGKRLENVLSLVWKRIDCFQALLKKDTDFCNRNAIKSFLRESRDYFLALLQDLPRGEAKVEKKLDSGESIRLRMELTRDALVLDFAGTSASTRMCLTDSATFGACFGAILTYLGRSMPLNSGTFSVVHVTTPLGCLLNAKFPSPTYKGMTEGTSQVASTVIQALGEIIANQKMADSSQSNTQLSLEWPTKGLSFFDALPGGVGASATANGADAIHFWQRNILKNSVQEIETRFPIRIEKIAIRKDSGGKGQYKGGNGLVKEYLLLENAKMHWILPQRKSPAMGAKGGKAAETAEIYILRKNKKVELISLEEGDLEVFEGDLIQISSGGGGGFGKA